MRIECREGGREGRKEKRSEGREMAGGSWIRGKLIGTGAFSKVSLAMNREDGEVFAVKSVEVDGSDANASCSMLAIENEIQLLQSLDSKYVVRCLGSDWTEESGKLMRNVFLEYMPEGSLADFLKQFAGAGALDEHLIRTYTRSIVEGIDYLHREGIVHCDIKGKNLLVRNGNVKLTDFGSAKRVGMESESEAMNCSAKVNGTPLWMAPEVVRQVEQGLPSDIWSLGCTVIEMATGRAPWSNLTNPFVALYHIGCTDELPEVPASLSAEAHDFLGKCFQRDPRKRWTSSQLLHHPFLTTRFVAKAAPAPTVVEAPLSPCSVMHFPNSDLSSRSFEDSIPLLSTPSFLKRGLVSTQKSSQSWGSSPFNDCAGEWIVVRSPKGSPPPSPSPFSNLMAPAFTCSVSPPEAVAICEVKEESLSSSDITPSNTSTGTPAPPSQKLPGIIPHVSSTGSPQFVGFEEVLGECRVPMHCEDCSNQIPSAEEATTTTARADFQHGIEYDFSSTSEVDRMSFLWVPHFSSAGAHHQHLKREELRRKQLHWMITIANIDWKASYFNHYYCCCTLLPHLYNYSYSPSWVKLLPFNLRVCLLSSVISSIAYCS